jgi:hypothetical protein
MDSMEAICGFNVKVGNLNHLERNQIWIVTVNKVGIVRLTVRHWIIVTVSFMYFLGDLLGQTSTEVLFLEEGPLYI